MNIKQELSDLIYAALGRLTAETGLEIALPAFNIDSPDDANNGDFSSNVALISAKVFRKPPRVIAEGIAKYLILDGSAFDRVEVAGAGFLNFFCGNAYYADTVRKVLSERENYGRTDYGNGKTILVEFVSANPTGPMHIGNARGGAIGDCLASVLDFAGFGVEREFYVNDAGNQINKFGVSLEARYRQLKGEDIEITEDMYKGVDITDLAQAFIDSGEQADGDTLQQKLVAFGLPKNIVTLEYDLLKYRIEYDNWFRESTLHANNAAENVITKLIANGQTYEKDGAIWLKAKVLGADEDVVLKRANGIVTYIVPDIAYHYDKLVTRKFDIAVDILGADHHAYVARIKAALTAIGIENIERRLKIIIMQMVRLVRHGEDGEKEIVKLSKRSGKAITLSSLLDDIPIDAARFFFNLRDAGTHLEFDLDLAIDESAKNPVYYVQYAHARICSVIKRSAAEGQIYDENSELNYTAHAEKELVKKIAQFPDEITQAAVEYDPSRITRYVLALAQVFHKFYDICRIKGEPTEVVQPRLALCAAAKQTIANALGLLKVTAPEKM
ncbi:MAG: arginine--tRNA ligase [Oscillospiraceae bacterium]|jgi:arginyl-tRNA synthetase|nr:arginine--tRNA ligase [Oscillospiraceae bacterium]